MPTRDVEANLSEALVQADIGEPFLFPDIVGTDLFQRFDAIVENVGVETWSNLIRNLRLSCENDWLTANGAPAYVIAAWIGHSVVVQNSYYAIVSDGHFEQSNAKDVTTSKSGVVGGVHVGGNEGNSVEVVLKTSTTSKAKKHCWPMKTLGPSPQTVIPKGNHCPQGLPDRNDPCD